MVMRDSHSGKVSTCRHNYMPNKFTISPYLSYDFHFDDDGLNKKEESCLLQEMTHLCLIPHPSWGVLLNDVTDLMSP